jgi:hypothetical protein
MGGQHHALATLPPEKARYPLYRRPVWTCAKNLAPPGFDPRTVQPVASRYTDYINKKDVTRILSVFRWDVSNDEVLGILQS